MKFRVWGLLIGALSLLFAGVSPAPAATTGHSSTVQVECSSSGFTVDANALKGQMTEVTAFYKASGIVCRLYDGTSGALLFDPSA